MLKELCVRRDLISELVLKELKVRYSHPQLRFFWAFLLPFLTVAVFYLIFAKFLKMEIPEGPAFLYLASALFPWRFFQDAVMAATTSLVDNRNLLKESSIPPYFIPVSVVIFHWVNFLPSLLIMIAASLAMLRSFSAGLLFLPLILGVHLATALGLSLIFSFLYLRWRDAKYAVEFLLLLVFYSTPVFYSLYFARKTLPDIFFKLYLYNPFTGILNIYRFVFFGNIYRDLKPEFNIVNLILVPLGFACLCAGAGLLLYKRHKDRINDYLSY